MQIWIYIFYEHKDDENWSLGNEHSTSEYYTQEHIYYIKYLWNCCHTFEIIICAMNRSAAQWHFQENIYKEF